MGYPLLRAADYPRFDPFLKAIAALQEDDLVDPARLSRSVEECEHFHEYLNDLFTNIGQRDELIDVPFDRRTAAESLRLYLGGSQPALGRKREVARDQPAERDGQRQRRSRRRASPRPWTSRTTASTTNMWVR